MSVVTTKGQATIPKSVREFLGITAGVSEVEFIVVNDHVEVIKKDLENPFEKVRGVTKGKLSTDEIMELTRG